MGDRIYTNIKAIVTLLVEENPKQFDSESRERFETYFKHKGATVEYLCEHGLTAADILWDIKHKFIHVEGDPRCAPLVTDKTPPVIDNTTPPLAPLPRMLVEPLIRGALEEDIGGGDLTTRLLITEARPGRAILRARNAGYLAGLDLATGTFLALDPAATINAHRRDGDPLEAGEAIATIIADTAALLTAERSALNFLSHLSGIATATARLVAAIKPWPTQLCCTRKTLPGLRILAKYAVRAGGGVNHRFSLDGGVLIKDNHIAAAGGIAAALRAIRPNLGPLARIEIEIDTLDQLEQALDNGVDAVLLDNMTPETLRRAVISIDGRAISEASGSITPETAPAIAAAGVDFLSSGWITMSAPALDIGLDWG